MATTENRSTWRIAIVAVAVLAGADLFVRAVQQMPQAQAASSRDPRVAQIAAELRKTNKQLKSLEMFLKAGKLKVQIITFPTR